MRMFGIHETHRRLAEVTYMSMDRNGNLILGQAELKLIMSLLKLNLALVQRTDELKNLSQVAYETGDTEWLQDLCRQIDKLEAELQ